MLALPWRKAAAMTIAALAAFGAIAQSSPPAAPAQAPLRLIVPFTPGTGIDLIARTVGPKLGRTARPPGRGGQPRRRFGQHRHGSRRAFAAQRLHAAGERQHGRHEPQPLPAIAVRPGQGPGAGHADQLGAIAAGGEPAYRLQDCRRFPGRRQAPAGQHQLRQPWRRHAAPSRDGTVEGKGRRVRHPYPLSRDRARASRTCWAGRWTWASCRSMWRFST